MEQKSYELFKIQSFAELLSVLLSGISFLFPFLIGYYLIIFTDSLSIGVLIAIFLVNDRVVGPLREISTSFNKINTTSDLQKNTFNKLGSILVRFGMMEKRRKDVFRY
ncbi:hypothetical protein [Enterococcus phoeniculicola]|uniref:hypothetical protein n=1 Tax=Enterococcus phoeniculicola TaxID=154621 RepID=UPI00055072FC|nr:hypothetical protein [Enterococcus phoeniculicola]